MKEAFDTIKYMALEYKNKGRGEDGVDCWGLVRLIYKNEYGIDLLSFDNQYENSADGERMREVIKYGKSQVTYKEKESPEYGDLIVFNIKGNPCHIGVYIGSNKVLHTLKGTNSVCERLSSGRLKGRVEGYYEVNKQNRSSTVQAPA